jgi:hypothetical protein
VTDIDKWRLKLLAAVEAQANDETLWPLDPSVGEAYVLQSLRWLHMLIEENDQAAFAKIVDQSNGDI